MYIEKAGKLLQLLYFKKNYKRFNLFLRKAFPPFIYLVSIVYSCSLSKTSTKYRLCRKEKVTTRRRLTLWQNTSLPCTKPWVQSPALHKQNKTQWINEFVLKHHFWASHINHLYPHLYLLTMPPVSLTIFRKHLTLSPIHMPVCYKLNMNKNSKYKKCTRNCLKSVLIKWTQ